MTNYNENMTLRAARQIVDENEVKGIACPCCLQFVKVYRRRIHSTMAKNLIDFLKYCEKNFKVEAHVSAFIDGHPGDFAKLAHWGLIEAVKQEDSKAKRCSGVWRITPRGTRFARYQTVEPEFALIRDGELIRLDGPAVDIAQCLGKKYKYSEVMN